VLPRAFPIRDAIRAALLTAGLYALVVAAIIYSGHISQRNFVDQNRFHLRAIFRFSDQWPRLDFSNYESATTPGYHVTLAFLHVWLTSDLTALRWFAMLFGVGTVALLAFALARRLPWPHAVVLAMPLAASPYVMASGAYLLPDNSAWWLVLAIFLVALRPRVGTPTLIFSGVLLASLVLFRQIHLWAAGLVWVAAAAQVLTPADDDGWPAGRLAVPVLDFARPLELVRRVLIAVVCTLPAFMIIAAFVRLWGGLAPPSFHAGRADPETNMATPVAGFNLATPGFILAILAFIAVPLLGYLWPVRRQLSPGLAALGAGVGFAIAAAPPSSWSLQAGRYSGLWNLARFAPQTTVLDRSLPIIALATVGGAVLAVVLALLSRRERLIFAAALAGFVAAHTLGALAWQRYFEPFVIMWATLAIACIARRAGSRPPGWAALGPLALTIVLTFAAWGSMA